MNKKIFGKVKNWDEVKKKGKGRFLLATSVMPIINGFVVFMAVAYLHSRMTGMPFGPHTVQKGLIAAAFFSIPSLIYGNRVWATNEKLRVLSGENSSARSDNDDT